MAPSLINQARSYVIEQIAEGRFEVGGLLPDTEMIAAAAGCSSGTANQALVLLAQAGVLQRVPRKGTIVVKNPRLDLGRVCLLQSQDAHTNGLLVEPIFTALSHGGCKVDVVPFSDKPSVTLSRCRYLRDRPEPAECLISLVTAQLLQRPMVSMMRQLQAMFERRIMFSIDSVDLAFDPDAHWVGLDQPAEARIVMEYLLNLGHRRIAVGAGLCPGEFSPVVTQAEMCRHIVELAGGEYTPVHFGPKSYVQASPALFRRRGVTAYWAITDHEAIKMANELHRAGVNIPGEISVIGRNDTPWCREVSPTLTTVSLDPPAVAAAIAAAVKSQVQEPAKARTPVTLVRPKLVERESSGPAVTRLA